MVLDIECSIRTKEAIRVSLSSLTIGDKTGRINFVNLFGAR